jgi:hypothetical protein
MYPMGNIFVKFGLEQLTCTGIFGPIRPDKVNTKADAALAGEINRDMRQPSTDGTEVFDV